VALDLANHAPIIQSLSFSPASPTTNDRLSANVDATDPDLGPGGYPTYPRSVTYEWSRNGTVLPDVTGSTIDLAQPGHGDRGDTITVVVTASDGELSATRSASVVIGNAAPTVSLSLDSSAPRTNDVLHALAIANDADGDPFTVTYAWSRNGTTIPGANGPTLDLASYGDRGDVIVATVTAVDDHGGTRTASASATVADSAPVASLALNTTAPRTLDSIVATVSASDADGDAITYLWYLRRNGNVVYSTSGSATASFDLSQPGWGDRWDTVTVQAVVGDRTLTTLVERSVTVSNTPPSVMPVLSSTTPRRGDVLVATAVVDDPDGETALTYTFTWTIGQKVRQTTTTGSSSDSFSLAGYNVGDVVKVTVVARDPFDASAPATATATISPR
jgi:hypothetical protein